ncbi:hypothetical protein Hs20B_12840 [Lactococcus insecticola]|uniref:Uncharacterized protein n=1 Tax=Pseudolactococcus insecticola TaxID=2709158 RepID=A0A6A0B7F9_9LACT|nr:hypothetical protein Hs20B_12840 [Lactococcus insecticola]
MILAAWLLVVAIFFVMTPKWHHSVRLEESQIIPKVTTTNQVLAVPKGDIPSLLADRETTVVVILNAKNTALNKKFDHFVNQEATLGVSRPIYIFQELYHDKFVAGLKLDNAVISIVRFDGTKQVATWKITDKTQLDQTFLKKLKEFSNEK